MSSPNRNNRRPGSPNKRTNTSAANNGETSYQSIQKESSLEQHNDVRWLYQHDSEILKLSQTQQQLVDKIAEGPQQHELVYAVQHEQLHHAKRNQIKTLYTQMTESARDHKLKQDDQIRRNAQLRGQLQ